VLAVVEQQHDLGVAQHRGDPFAERHAGPGVDAEG
jgi:hypothetical protein